MGKENNRSIKIQRTILFGEKKDKKHYGEKLNFART